MGNRLWAMIRKEFIQIRRDRRALAMMLLIPVIWLVMFGYAASFDVKTLKLALINASGTPVADQIEQALRSSDKFTLVDVTDRTKAGLTEVLRRSDAQVAILIPAGAYTPGSTSQLEVLVDGSDYFAAASSSRLLQDVLRGPVPGAAPTFTVLFNPDLKSANVMIPGLLGMVLLFITTLMTALGVVREREAGTLEQLAVTPIRPVELMLGKILPYAVIGLVDFFLVLGCGIWVFDVSFQGNLPLFVGLSLLFLLCTLSLGLLVSTLAQNQAQAIQMALFTLLPQFLLSGFVFPLGAMPASIRAIAYLFPLTYYIPIARGMFLKGAGLDLLAAPATGLAVYAVLLVVLASVRFRKRIA